jgi:CRISPR/Cas system CSM-associated protein Csm5 (group 7 of RAMP superfamily)
MNSVQELDAFWARHRLTKKHAKKLLASNLGKDWKETSFPKVKEGDILMVSYVTHSQLRQCDWENQCGVVLSLNRNEDGDIFSITLLVQNEEQVNVPYELEENPESMGGYTNDHTTYLQRLE